MNKTKTALSLIFIWALGMVAYTFIQKQTLSIEKSAIESRHEVYEAYKRVYKVDLTYQDWSLLYNRNMLPKTIENK